MHSNCCAGLENHVIVGGEGAHVCLTCGHGAAEAGVVGPALVAIVGAVSVGYLAWQAAKALRERFAPANA
jgi:hypothetical protein